MSNPYKELVRLFDNRTKKYVNASTISVSPELGTITNTGLKLDNFKYEIQDYFIADYLNMKSDFFTNAEENSGSHSQYTGNGIHNHKIVTPQQLKPLAAGDRVLSLPVNGGRDFVVIARVVNK